jgi:hypothetical protein
MTYSKTRAELVNIVQWLHGSDELEWVDRIDLLAESIFALKELVPSMIHQTVVPPEGSAICFAMPQLIGMLAAMYGGQREKALECGQMVLDILPECSAEDGAKSVLLSRNEARVLSHS